jgi:sugar transferase (PEP-CTERM system associated)
MLALYLGLEFRFQGDAWHESFGSFFPKAILYASIILLSMIGFGLYQRQPGRFIEAIALRLVGALFLGFIPLTLIFYLAPAFYLGRGVLGLTGFLSCIFILATRVFYRRVVKERNMWSKVLVLGAGKGASSIVEAENSGNLKNINIVGYVRLPDDSPDNTDINGITLNESLVKYAEEKRIDEIVLAVSDRRSGLPTKELLECKMSGIDVLDLLTFFERKVGKIRLDILYPSWLYLSDGFRESTFRRVGKRVFDIGVALSLLPLLFPFIVMAAVGIFIESKGKDPIIYSQLRIKQDGKPFSIYKFRSMTVDAEKDGVARWASKDDARITRVGSVLRKARLDEIPQLYNVLKGDMSFVGPRPERPEFVEQLKKKSSYYDERHRVKPGVTGWAQIRYPYGESLEDGMEKLQYDLYYVKNYSIFLDLLILLQTAEVVLLGKGAQ